MATLIPMTPAEQVVERLYAGIESREKQELWLTRLGASTIGEPCMRALWYGWRGVTHKTFDGRLLRLFETGHLQEDRIVEDLMYAGLKVWAADGNGKQFTYTGAHGHFVCKLDGVVKGVDEGDTPHVCEIKTHSDKSWKEVQKKGVFKAKPLHYAQMQAGMWLTGLDKALYVALNKNDESYYIEVVERDDEAIRDIETRLEKLLSATMPPAGISQDASGWGCTYCDYKEVCAGVVEPLTHCRTCRNVSPIENGEWLCTKHGVSLNRDEQLRGCTDWEKY